MARIIIDEAKLERQVEKALKAFAVEFSNKMGDAAPGEGRLQAEIRKGWSVEKTTGGFIINFRMPKRAGYLEFGTGIWGPSGRPIVPKKPGGVLAWIADVPYRDKYGPMHMFKGSPNWYIFKSVRGIRPIPFIRPTIHKDFVPLLRKNLRRFVKG